MKKFELLNLNPETWQNFKARGDREGWDVYALAEQLMDDYGRGKITPSTPPQNKRSLSRRA